MQGIAFRIERDELHERLGGAIPRGVLGLLEGEPGSGRSVLCQRLVHGALENGHTVAYLTTEHPTLSFLRQMHSLGYDAGPAVAKGKLLLLTAFPTLAPRARPADALGNLASAAALWRRDLVVVDDLSTLLAPVARARGEDAARAGLDALVQRIRVANAGGTTALLTADREGPLAALLGPLRAGAELLLDLRVELVGASLARRMMVRRLAKAPERTGDTMGFRVEPGIGLLVEIRSVT